MYLDDDEDPEDLAYLELAEDEAEMLGLLVDDEAGLSYMEDLFGGEEP